MSIQFIKSTNISVNYKVNRLGVGALDETIAGHHNFLHFAWEGSYPQHGNHMQQILPAVSNKTTNR
jgi:hypothetical protein